MAFLDMYERIGLAIVFLFTSRYVNRLSPDFDLSIDGTVLNCVNQSKFLGVIDNKNLSWSSHVSYILVVVVVVAKDFAKDIQGIGCNW